MIVIGLCLAVFIGLTVFSQKKNLDLYKREFILVVALPTLVFLISLFSGASYSDDFPLFLAVIAIVPIVYGNLTGMSSMSLGGTSIIIVVGVCLETVKQMESQMMMRHYKGFLD